MDQGDDVATFLLDFGLDSEPVRTSPMPNLNLLLSDDTVLGPNIEELVIFSNFFDYSMDGHKKEWMGGGYFIRYMTY